MSRIEDGLGKCDLFMQFGQSLPLSTMVNPIPVADLRIINTDPHQCQKGLVPVSTPNGGIMWVYPDIVKDDGQWTTVSPNKSKGKGKAKACQMVYISVVESDSNSSFLFDTDDEEILAIGIKMPLVTTTSRQNVGDVPSIKSPLDTRGWGVSL